jgi:alpha-tubulin suppressor-like RCC1 family protein
MVKRTLGVLISFLLMAMLITPYPVWADGPADGPADRPAADAAFGGASAMTDILAIAAGGQQTCMITSAGGVVCWGYTGYLDVINKVPTENPDLLNNVKAIALGMEHTCALTNDGGVKCWGSNAAGSLGDGTSTPSRVPVQVTGLTSGVTAIAAGRDFSCAIVGSGVQCWGDNFYGQLGNGSNTDSKTPVSVSNLSGNITAIAAGWGHACAIVNGAAKCWGDNWNGQLGNGKLIHSNVPVPVTGLTSGVTAIAAGASHTCAIVRSVVQCWGYVYNKGNTTPVSVPGLTGVTAIATNANGGHICAIVTNGALKCWGANNYGQLGDGTTGNQKTPVPVFNLSSGVSAVATGDDHTCAIKAGQIKCWGSNAYGQLGNGSTVQRMIAVDASLLQSRVTSLSAGDVNTCAITDGGGALCWGDNSDGLLGNGNDVGTSSVPVAVSGLSSDVSQIATGSNYSCAVVSGGVKCWGWNNSAGLGIGNDFSYRYTPVDASGLTSGSGVTRVVVGRDGHTCALMAFGGVKCWGNNGSGQAGNYGTFNTVPTDVMGWTNGIADIAAGYFLTCALTDAGGVECTGLLQDNGSMAEYYYPTAISGLSGVKAISAGFFFACALTDSGGVMCWGSNTYGQLGDGTKTHSLAPVNVSGLDSGVRAISLGDYHACALLESGGVKCWGRGAYLGRGSFDDSAAPVEVTGLSDEVEAISAGSQHNCVLLQSGRVKCWGFDGYGQLAIGTLTTNPVPTDLVLSIRPGITSSYRTGLPGSYFAITGDNYPPNSLVTISINDTILTNSFPVNEAGSFIFFLDSQAADLGDYLLTVNGVNAIVRLQPSAPLRLKEGGGTLFSIPPGLGKSFPGLYLPVVTR